MADIFVARGTPVVVVTRAVGHDKQHILGEETNGFKPERWRGLRPVWEYIPFWAGPRICPAQEQVFTHSVYLIVQLTQKLSLLRTVIRCTSTWKMYVVYGVHERGKGCL